ncbi:MAG: PAS domain S-box protein, partial [Pseudomonadota bacterium]
HILSKLDSLFEMGYHTHEYRFLHKDGTYRWIYDELRLIYDVDGKPTDIVGNWMDITDRKQAEEALRESEEKYRNIFNSAQVGIFRTRISDGKVLECNDRFARTYGYETPEECMADFVVSEHYTDPGTREKMVASLMEKGEVSNLEARFSRKDGDDVWVRFFARAYPEEGYLEGVGYDITEEKRALEALQKSEAQKKAILDASIDVIRLVDKDMKIIWANKTTTTELKAAPEQLVGSFCYEAVAGRDTPCPGCPTKKALKSGKIERAFIHHKELKGIKEETYWDDYAVPIKNESGDIINLIQISRNITERKQAEEALRESEKKYRTILESIEDGYFEVDIAGNLMFFNDSVCELIGYAKDELIGMNNRQCTDEENAKEVYETFNRVYTTGKPDKGFDWGIVRKDGSKRYVEASVSLRRDAEGKPARILR